MFARRVSLHVGRPEREPTLSMTLLLPGVTEASLQALVTELNAEEQRGWIELEGLRANDEVQCQTHGDTRWFQLKLAVLLGLRELAAQPQLPRNYRSRVKRLLAERRQGGLAKGTLPIRRQRWTDSARLRSCR